MMLDLQTPGELRITTVDYLKGVLEDFPEVKTGRSTSLEDNHLFQVSTEEKQTLLDKEWATAFHHTVAQLVFVTSRARKQIKMAIAFLCNRVRIPKEDYRGNLVRVIVYIRGTLHLPLVLRSDILNVIK